MSRPDTTHWLNVVGSSLGIERSSSKPATFVQSMDRSACADEPLDAIPSHGRVGPRQCPHASGSHAMYQKWQAATSRSDSASVSVEGGLSTREHSVLGGKGTVISAADTVIGGENGPIAAED